VEELFVAHVTITSLAATPPPPAKYIVSNPIPGSIPTTETPHSTGTRILHGAPTRSTFPAALGKILLLACALFLVTLCTCLIAGTHFAIAYAHDEAVSWDEFIGAFTLIYRHPLALAAGLPFALTLLTILLVHELGHFFACRHHHIHSSYPFFIPFPTLIGTLGAFILIRSPIRNTRALFDVGASGPSLVSSSRFRAIYGIVHAKFIPGLSVPAENKIVLGAPLILQLLAPIFHHGANAANLLLHPVGRQHGSDFLPLRSTFCPPRNWTAGISSAQLASTLIESPLSFSRCSWRCWDFAIGPAGICGRLC